MAAVEVSPTPASSESGLGSPLLFQRSMSGSESLHVWLGTCGALRELPDMADGELERKLRLPELTLLGVGACIGAGIFVLTGVEAHVAGPSVGLSFLLAAVSSMFNGMCFSELASRLPISGSAYLYTYCAIGELTALMVVANQLMDYHIGAAALSRSLVAYLARGFSEALGITVHECVVECRPLPSALPWLSVSLGAPAVLGLVTFVVAGGAKTNATVTGAMTVLKVIIALIVIFVGANMVDTSLWVPAFPHGLSATLEAAATLNYAFIGYDVIANAAEECVDPQRDVPAAIVAALSCCGLLYLCMCMVLCGMQSSSEMDLSAPVSSAFAQRGMLRVASVINVGAFAGMLTGLLAGLYGQSRIYFALARDHMAPAVLRGTPKCAVWCGGFAALLAAFLDLQQLASVLNIGVLLSYSMTAASVLLINSCDRASEGVLVAAVAASAALLAVGQRFWPLLCGLAATALACLVAGAALRRGYTCCPSGTFSCPGKPLTPLVALICNVYLAAELSWHAWVRLVAVAVFTVAVHSAVSCLGWLDHPHVRHSSVCKTVMSAANTAGTNAGVCGGACG